MIKLFPTIYPPDTVKKIHEWNMDEKTYIQNNRGSFTYEGNSGHPEPSLVVSPYFQLSINGQSIQVYATVAYVGTKEVCALHSYAIVEVYETQGFQLDIVLTSLQSAVKKVIVLPASLNTMPALNGNHITATINEYGDYSFLMNDEDTDISQFNAFTLFVRRWSDEETEIARYKAKYGEKNVAVYEPGTHPIDYINIEKNDFVLYIKRGALLTAKGNPSYGENTPYTEAGAKENGSGRGRYPLIGISYKQNVHIVGRGAIDGGQLGWHERNGVVVTHCSKIEISGLTLLNIPEWNIITSCCSDVDIRDVQIFGYKTNSDGFAICNSVDTTVSGCFARSGDDLFEIKTFNGTGNDSISRNVTFSNCIAWAGKARCFGVIAELIRDVSNILFKDCAVIYRDAIWDNDILGSLVIICSEGDGRIFDITFENIEIFYDYGHAINIVNTDGKQKNRQVKNILFRNVVYNAALPNLFNTQNIGTNQIDFIFDNVTGNGVLLTEDTIHENIEIDKQSTYTIINSK